MNRFVFGAFGIVSILAAFAIGCAAIPSTETVEEGFVEHGLDDQDEIGSAITGEQPAGGRRSVVTNGLDPTRKAPSHLCAGCGPVPDPWARGPVPDPWGEPSPSTSSSSSGGSDTSGGGSKH